jgi:hypothetical protein
VGVRLIGVANKTPYLVRSWALPNDSKYNEADFSTDSLYLRVTQMPKSQDLAIFVLTTDRQTDCFTPAVHARTRGNEYTLCIQSPYLYP